MQSTAKYYHQCKHIQIHVLLCDKVNSLIILTREGLREYFDLSSIIFIIIEPRCANWISTLQLGYNTDIYFNESLYYYDSINHRRGKQSSIL